MTVEKAGGYISKICLNNGASLDIQENDIVIFVGPNNAGKSQALKDIYNLCESKKPSTVISDIEVTKSSIPLDEVLSRISLYTDTGGSKRYDVLGKSYFTTQYSDTHFMSYYSFDSFRNIFVANLDTAARLTICKSPQSVARNGIKTHPIHYAAFESKYRKWLSDNFKKAFDIEVTPNILYGAEIPLCMGAPVVLDGTFESEQDRQETYAEILNAYQQVHNQGDGIKSFTGILLYLMLDYYRVYLIDEPESFLHPPQARIMGEILGKTLSDQQQAFISTHSEEIIKGLLEACPNRIKIIRITREEDKNTFSILENDRFSEVWNDPLLKYSNIMSSLFHKTVALCESDSDCKMYSIVESHIKQVAGKYAETLFVHCGGKHRMAKIATALRALNVNVKLIPDIDVMNDETIFKGIIESFGIDWESIRKDYNIVVSNLHSPKEEINRNDVKTTINRVLDSSTNQKLSKQELKDIRTAISTISKWENIKKMGFAAIPPGEATVAMRKINQVLSDNGIHIVPVGELECFVKDVGGHGPEWANKVLETYPDLSNGVYAGIKDFISGINL